MITFELSKLKKTKKETIINILIVDDSSQVLEEMKDIIKETDHTLFCATNGAEGLSELAVSQIDVVMSDFNMPKMDGLTMVEFFKKIEKNHVAIIMITARISSDLKDKGDELGITAWMPKPLKKDVILKVLEDLESKKNKST